MSNEEPGLGRGFWQLWTSSAVSNLADGILKVGLPLVAIRYTDSPGLIAGLALAMTLPWLLFALPAGALTDRWDRRRAMVGADVIRGLLLVLLAGLVAVDAGSIWLLYVIGFAVGITETIYDTSAQSILPQIVDRAALPKANGRLHAVELTANQFIGPPLGGFLVAAGLALSIATPAGMWLLAAAVLVWLPGHYRVERLEKTSIRADIAEGLRFLLGHRLLRTMAAMVGVMNFASNVVFGVFVLYAVGSDSAMGLSDPEYGALLTTLAIGSLVGALVAARVADRLGRARSMSLTMLASAAAWGAPAVTSNPWVIGAFFTLGGVGIAIWNVVTVSLRQNITPDRLLGRLNSCYRLLAWGTIPLGAAAGGIFGEAFGLQTAFAVAGVVSLTALAGMLVVTDRSMDEAERQVVA
jgi:MFS family permease